MIPATLVLFAIQAGIRLGRKVYDVLVEKNFSRALPLPLGELAGDPLTASAQKYFDEDGWDWIKPGGPLRDPEGPLHDIFLAKGPLAAYQTLLGLTEIDSSWSEARNIISGMQKFEQFKEKQDPGMRQILGTVVDIGIDFLKVNPFFKIDPLSVQGGSAAQQVIGAFVTHLDEINFEDDKSLFDLGGKVLEAGLEVFGGSANLITGDKRLQFLFRDVTQALVEDIDLKKIDQDFLERVVGSVLRGAMTGITENPALFIRGDSQDTQFIRITVTDVLNGLKTQKDLFTPTSLEIIFKNALVAVSESAGLVTKEKFLQELIQDTLGVLTKPGQKVFAEATFAGIVEAGLETLGKNAGSLIQETGAARQFLVEGLTALTTSLGTSLAGGDLKAIFSSKQLIGLTGVVFGIVAQHPEALLGEATDPKKSVLANIISVVALALKDDPRKLISGDSYVQILQIALQVGAQNIDKILELADPGNLLNAPLYQLLKGLMEAAPELSGSLHSGNFPQVFEKLLMHFLLGNLVEPLDTNTIIDKATTILLSTL